MTCIICNMYLSMLSRRFSALFWTIFFYCAEPFSANESWTYLLSTSFSFFGNRIYLPRWPHIHTPTFVQYYRFLCRKWTSMVMILRKSMEYPSRYETSTFSPLDFSDAKLQQRSLFTPPWFASK